jgi:hypothetical protein
MLYTMTSFATIIMVLTMMSKNKVVALDDQWISMALDHFKISRDDKGNSRYGEDYEPNEVFCSSLNKWGR